MGDITFALSLCRKAGALVYGFDAVKERVYTGEAHLALYADDISAGTRARVERFCEGLVPVLPLGRTQAEVAHVLKKPAGVFAITDPELAKLCRKCAGAAPDNTAQQKEERPCQL